MNIIVKILYFNKGRKVLYMKYFYFIQLNFCLIYIRKKCFSNSGFSMVNKSSKCSKFSLNLSIRPNRLDFLRFDTKSL